MSATSCSTCGDTRWVRYLSETMNGDFEEAFRLCLCNHEPETQGERSRVEPEQGKVVVQKLASPSEWDA